MDPHFPESRYVALQDDAPNQDHDIASACLLKTLQDFGNQNQMVTGEKTHSHDIHVFLNRSIDHFPHGLSDSGKNHLHARIAQCSRDDFCASIMAVEADLSNQNPNFSFTHDL